jgi:3-oxoacyl-[acyl-carrier-protein] synthase III
MDGIRIAGIASQFPSRRVSNHDLFSMVTGYDAAAVRERNGLSGMSDVDVFDWHVRSMTGIRQRFYIDPKRETTETLMCDASVKALERANLRPQDIDFIITSSSTPFQRIPNSVCTVAERLGIRTTPGIAVDTACTGALYAYEDAQNRILSGRYDTILVCNGESFSPILDFSDFSTAILFGDGAAATILQRSASGGLSSPFYLASDYSPNNIVKLDIEQYIGDELRIEDRTYIPHDYMRMNGGPQVLRNAVRTMTEAAIAALVYARYNRNYYETHRTFFEHVVKNPRAMHDGIPNSQYSVADLLSDVAVIIPHQANQRIISGTAERLLDKTMHKTVSIIESTGNISGVTAPIALERLIHGQLPQRINPGDRVLFTSVGGGYTIGGFVLKY